MQTLQNVTGVTFIGGGSLFNCSVPEKRLIAAIFEQSFRDLHSTNTELREDAAWWLQSKHAAMYAEILGLDGEVLLRGVMYHLEQIGEPELMRCKATSKTPLVIGDNLRQMMTVVKGEKRKYRQLELTLFAG